MSKTRQDKPHVVDRSPRQMKLAERLIEGVHRDVDVEIAHVKGLFVRRNAANQARLSKFSGAIATWQHLVKAFNEAQLDTFRNPTDAEAEERILLVCSELLKTGKIAQARLQATGRKEKLMLERLGITEALVSRLIQNLQDSYDSWTLEVPAETREMLNEVFAAG